MTESETHNDHGHEAPSYDDINTPVIVLVGAISALVTLITIMFVQGLYYNWRNNFMDQRAMDAENLPAVVQIENQKEMLTGQDGLVSIEDAMKKVVSNYGSAQ